MHKDANATRSTVRDYRTIMMRSAQDTDHPF